jgi:uncharacterized protein (TIGR02246 family)
MPGPLTADWTSVGRCDNNLGDEEACMRDEQGALLEIVRRLEQAWNNGDSVAWTAEFANDADSIQVLGGFFHGSRDIEHGHRTIFDPMYKGSHNRYEVEKVRLLRRDVAVVFIRANLTWYLNGQEQHIQARPTLVAEKSPTGEWKIAVFQNTLITPEAVPTLAGIQRLLSEAAVGASLCVETLWPRPRRGCGSNRNPRSCQPRPRLGTDTPKRPSP